MKPRIEFDESKNQLLKVTRGVCFEDVVTAISRGAILDELAHKQIARKRSQRILVVEINGYAYAVPYVVQDKEKDVLFLKTVYPSRILTQKYFPDRRSSQDAQKKKRKGEKPI